MAAGKRVGVLALQGDFEAHLNALADLGADAVPVRSARDLSTVAGLLMPGGESTAMLKLIEDEGLFEPLRAFGRSKPIFGTCAGAILLAAEVSGPRQTSLALMDIDVERNGYGRQLDSRIAPVAAEGIEGGDLEAVFIRAPVIRRAGEAVRVLARYQGTPVLVEQGLHMAATFHPELSSDRRVHLRFLAKAV